MSCGKSFCYWLSVKPKTQTKPEIDCAIQTSTFSSISFFANKEVFLKSSADYNNIKHNKTTGVLLLIYLLGSGVGSKCWVMSEMIMPFEYTSTGDTSSYSETHSNVTYFQYDRIQAPFTTKQHRVR